jgi:hypothetical protein
MLFVAVGVYETGFGVVRRAVCSHGDLDNRLAGSELPAFPLAWALWPIVDGQEPVPADSTAAVLGVKEPQAGRVDRQGWCLAPAFGPIVTPRRTPRSDRRP